MRVLMLGWEFPPFFAGGVGVVANSLTKALVESGDHVTFVMPYGPDQAAAPHVRLIVSSQQGVPLRVRRIQSLLEPYGTRTEYHTTRTEWARRRPGEPSLYGADLLEEVERFAYEALEIVREEDEAYDVIHAHDWTTFPAGVALRDATGCPLVVHVHITEFDKSGGAHADPGIWAIEHAGMAAADRVIAVSRRVRDTCVNRYGIDPSKVDVVYNAVDQHGLATRSRPEPMVLFLGRVTLQKGPDYFVEAARRVLDVRPAVHFVLAGSGDMLERLILRSAQLGMAERISFAGFVDREQVLELYSRAAVFVMPSVSEPFGIVPLEAMDRGVPVIVSRQSGVAEVLRSALKVDFWDVEGLAARIVAAVDHAPLRAVMRREGDSEVRGFTWDLVADQVRGIYEAAIDDRAR